MKQKEYTIDDFKKAKTIKPKPKDWRDEPLPEELRRQYEREDVQDRYKKTIEADASMRYDVLRQIGIRLQNSELETISTADLYAVLRKATGTMDADRLKYYAKLLKDDGYIRFSSHGVWDIIKDGD